MRSVTLHLSTDLSCVNFRQPDLTTEPWDIDCPECGSFPSAACLRKTIFSDGACSHKGCEVGNNVRAAVGLPPLQKRDAETTNYRVGKKKAKCACGRNYYANELYIECALCRHKRALLKARCQEEKRQLRHKIFALEGAEKRGGR